MDDTTEDQQSVDSTDVVESSDTIMIPPHPLHRKWCTYVHYPLYTSATESYGSRAYCKIFDFDTVEDFWNYFYATPPPSLVFANDQRPRRKLDGRQVEGFGVFTEGVKPEWEETKEGCHLEFGFITDASILDTLWEVVCLLLVGETMCQPAHVVGVRVVDKSKARKPLYRLEVWVGTKDEQVKQAVASNVVQAVQKEGHNTTDFSLVWKNH